MKFLASGFPKTNFRTMDFTINPELNSLKITNEKNDYQIQIIIEDELELKKVQTLLNKITFPGGRQDDV